MKAWLLFGWRWSWIVTLPIACLFVYWGWVTVERFYTFGVRYDSAPVPYSLHDSGKQEFNTLVRKTKLAVSNSWDKKIQSQGDLKVVNLFVSESNLAEINSNLPHSGFKYVKGRLWDGDKLQKIKFRYRGDFVYHWGQRKKSLRIKTSKKKLFDGIRTFNLIGTKQLETHFGCLLAKEMGLIAPITDLVEVTLNGGLLGTYVYVEQLEELTLRSNGRIPGDLYAGELMAKDSYQGIDSQIFNHPQLWKKIAVNNHYQNESRKPLEKLLALINSSDLPQAQEELSELLDIDAWGKFVAFETLIQSFHYDNTHNWRLYYDPMKSRFYPVIWDPIGWHSEWVPKQGFFAQLDIIPSRFHKFLFENADILRSRASAIKFFFKNGYDKKFLHQVKQSLPGWNRAIERDPLLVEPTEKVLDNVNDFRQSIKKVFSDIRQGYLEEGEPLTYAVSPAVSTDVIISLSVAGRIPTSKLRLYFALPIDGPVTATLTYDVDGKKNEKDISGAISLRGSSLEINNSLISQYEKIIKGSSPLKENQLKTVPAYYVLTLAGIKPSNQFLDLSYKHGDGKYLLAERVSVVERSSFSALYNIVKSQPVVVPEIWGGVIDITGRRVMNKLLLIKPGTVVRFAPGASLLLKGRLVAEGTQEEPIQFISRDAGQEPWGAVTVYGQGANGSLLKYCKFAGGSGLKSDLFEYTAMFSVHDVKGVVVEHCLFRDSKITDDMVHVVYADIRFSDCTFERSLMDALDVDISDAIIERCHFLDSGNDSIDLMTSNVIVVDTLVENGVDKAVSVGEGSKLLAINDVFKNNVFGVQLTMRWMLTRKIGTMKMVVISMCISRVSKEITK